MADPEPAGRPADLPAVGLDSVGERQQHEVGSLTGVAGLSISLEGDTEFDLVLGQPLELAEPVVQLEDDGR